VAQVTGDRPRPFDDRWRERLPLAIRVLGDIQTGWLQSDTPFPVEQTAAVILRIFGFDFFAASSQSAGVLWRRTAAEWLSCVSGLEAECGALCPAAEPAVCADVAAGLREMLARAAETWERHSPVTPSCEDVIHQALKLLASRRFVLL
jgi:hypothetical protein